MNIKEYKNQLKLELNEYKDKLKEKLNEYKEKLNLKLKKFKEREDKKKSKKPKKTTKKGGYSNDNGVLKKQKSFIIKIDNNNEDGEDGEDGEDKDDKPNEDDKDCDKLYNEFMNSLKPMNQTSLQQSLTDINKKLEDAGCSERITSLKFFEYLGKNRDNMYHKLNSNQPDDDSSPDGDGIKLEVLKEILTKKELIELKELEKSEDSGNSEKLSNITKGLDYFLKQIINK